MAMTASMAQLVVAPSGVAIPPSSVCASRTWHTRDWMVPASTWIASSITAGSRVATSATTRDVASAASGAVARCVAAVGMSPDSIFNAFSCAVATRAA